MGEVPLYGGMDPPRTKPERFSQPSFPPVDWRAHIDYLGDANQAIRFTFGLTRVTAKPKVDSQTKVVLHLKRTRDSILKVVDFGDWIFSGQECVSTGVSTAFLYTLHSEP